MVLDGKWHYFKIKIMMIKRIQEIINVGTFGNFSNGGSKTFEKLTFIYGLNTYGKTSLCDIFQSLSENNPEILKARKTIPNDNYSTNQSIKLKISINNKEEEISFSNNEWSKTISDLEVFGTDFIHKNLFTGSIIERQNKENFTDFILGSEGFALGEKLENLKKSKADKAKECKKSIPAFVKHKRDEEIKSFIERKVERNLEEIKNNLSTKQEQCQKEQTLFKDAAQILDRKEISILNLPQILIIQNIDDINRHLSKSFQDIQQDAKEKFFAHIEFNFKPENKDQAEKWLKQGLDYGKSLQNNCLFCGQELEKAKSLINAYQSYFNQRYINFVAGLTDKLSSGLNYLKKIALNINQELVGKISTLKDYQDLFSHDDRKKLKEFEDLQVQFQNKENSLNQNVKNIIQKIENLTEGKQKEPYKAVNTIDCSNLNGEIESYLKEMGEINEIISFFIDRINQIKKPYKDNTKSEEIKKLEGEIVLLKLDETRLEQDKECKDYIALGKEIDDLEKKIKELNEQILEQQSAHLNEYFEKINFFFKELGSADFTLVKKEENNGHKKVYCLSVKYKTTEIKDKELKVFSESDKRALALAVFLAKIDLKNEQDKKNTIIVLDDPITSFDDNRVRKAVEIIENLKSKIGQIIVLTHYNHFIKVFFEQKRDSCFKLFKIEKNRESAVLEDCEKEFFCLDNLSKEFFEIYDFIINAKQSNNIETGLRRYIENFLKIRFIYQIANHKIDQKDLNTLLNGLEQVIENEHYQVLKNFNHTTSADVHQNTSDNKENTRQLATEIINFLHGDSIKLKANINQ
jgi:wobble nucleotide-excising tRNase